MLISCESHPVGQVIANQLNDLLRAHQRDKVLDLHVPAAAQVMAGIWMERERKMEEL